MEKKNNRGTIGKIEEHFLRHVQGLGLRKNSRRTPEKLFGGPAEAKEPQKRHVQGSDTMLREREKKTLILIHCVYLQLRKYIYTRLTTIHVTYIKKETLYTINSLYSTEVSPSWYLGRKGHSSS